MTPLPWMRRASNYYMNGMISKRGARVTTCRYPSCNRQFGSESHRSIHERTHDFNHVTSVEDLYAMSKQFANDRLERDESTLTVTKRLEEDFINRKQVSFANHDSFTADGTEESPCLFSWDSLWNTDKPNFVVEEEVYNYYSSFNDQTCSLFPEINVDNVLNRHVPEDWKALLDHCMETRYTGGEVRAFFDVVIKDRSTFAKIHDFDWNINDSKFQTSDCFYKFVQRRKKAVMKRQGWMEMRITSDFGTTEVGYFIPLRCAINDIIDEYGGSAALIRYTEHRQKHERTFSHPMDSETVRNLSRETRTFERTVFYSLYIDSTILSKSGSQDALIARVRIENLPNAQGVWRTVAILPQLQWSGPHNTETYTNAKQHLFQRSVFCLIKSVSIRNPETEYNLPMRLLTTVTDYPQERDLLSLQRCKNRGEMRLNCSSCERNFTTHENDEDEYLNSTDEFEKQNLDLHDEQDDNDKPTTILEEKTAQLRDPFNTVTKQLFCALGKKLLKNDDQMKDVSLFQVFFKVYRNRRKELKERLSSTENYLNRLCARPFPPALACLSGMVTTTQRLYSITSWDKLHIWDLGIIRTFADKIYTVTSSDRYLGKNRRNALTKLANARIYALPRETNCRRRTPFRLNAKEKQAAYSGKHWREIGFLIWYALYGLRRNVSPDNDDLLKSALLLHSVPSELSGANQSSHKLHKTVRDITNLQENASNLVDRMKTVFSMAETSKVHRTKCHITDFILDFGSLQFGNTDVNETMHKGPKTGYRATNKQQTMELQILINNSAVERSEEKHVKQLDIFYSDTVIPSEFKTMNEELMSSDTLKANYMKAWNVCFVARKILSSMPDKDIYDPDDVMDYLLTSTLDEMRTTRFRFLTRMDAYCYLPLFDKNSKKVRQRIHCERNGSSQLQYLEAVKYIDSNLIRTTAPRKMMGFIQGIFKIESNTSNPNNSYTVLMRPLRLVNHMDGQSCLSNHGIDRYMYVTGDKDIVLSLVPAQNVFRRVLILFDSFGSRKVFPLNEIFSREKETRELRLSISFLHVSNFPSTTLGRSSMFCDETQMR